MADRVLIVDDDKAICKLLEKVMRSNEMETTVVNNGLQALNVLTREHFDVILLDVNLEDMEGFDVLRRLRGQGVNTPVMIISGRSEDYDSLYGLSLGADDYVTKPFRPLVLGAKVKALIGAARSFLPETSSVCAVGNFPTTGPPCAFIRGRRS